MNTKYLWILLVVLSFSSCKEEDDFVDAPAERPALTAGNADFSNFVAIGNSLTAGFTDNALFIAGQENSIPNILSQQFALVGGGSFNQPLMNDNTGGMIIPGTDDLPYRLIFNGSGPQPLNEFLESNNLPVPPVTTNVTENLMSTFNNMGVPGAKVSHLLFDGYAALNPYYARMATAPNATIIGDAIAQNPTFFSLWIGNNDVLGYALSGGDGTNPITDSGTFTAAYNTLIQSLTANDTKGVIANIPSVATIPHFTTVPHNPLDPTNPDFGSQIPLLNTVFGALNQIFTALGETDRMIVFNTDAPSAVIIKDETLNNLSNEITGALMSNPAFPIFVEQNLGLPAAAAPLVANLMGVAYGQARQATENDLLVLPSSAVIGQVNSNFFNFLISEGLSPQLAGTFALEGITYAMDDKWILLPSEQEEILAATNIFNQVISDAATQNGLALVDANMLMQLLADGNFVSGNFNPSSSLVLGGVFSLDGVHPNSRGYALIANEFMKAIDDAYESNFEASGNLVDTGNYPTNYSPTLQ